jgi:pyruvate kinase
LICFLYMIRKEDQESIRSQLEEVLHRMDRAENERHLLIEAVKPSNLFSAMNLIDYLSLRAEDVSSLQASLHKAGLSSLASSEGRIRAQVVQILTWLGSNRTINIPDIDGDAILKKNSEGLFGEPAANSALPVMVTLDRDFAGDKALAEELLQNGMSIARINCAHDDEKIWTAMINTLNKTRASTGLNCRLYMDIAGPKIRTRVITRKHDQGKLHVTLDQKIMLTDLGREDIAEKKFIHCTQPGIIERLRPGHRVFFDDGLFEAVAEAVQGKTAVVRMVGINTPKAVIKGEKGINFPDTTFRMAPLTDFDRHCLPFIVNHADMLGFSFVSNAGDLKLLQDALRALHKPALPIIAKIETAAAVEHLPEIILQGLQQNSFGVMVARGDLALEIGFERLSEIQDEILWICQAAHVPVIWATQVLETFQKSGIATRGEITDAVHAALADCVMLNKGDHTAGALQLLHNVLGRSRQNNYKNERIFRSWSIARAFFGYS